MGLCTGVCLFFCTPCLLTVSCPNVVVCDMALLYVIASPGVPDPWTEEGTGRCRVAALGGGRWCRAPGPSRTGNAERSFPWMDLHFCFSLAAISFLFPPISLQPIWDPAPCLCSCWAAHHWENALWESDMADHGISNHLYSNNYAAYLPKGTQQEEKGDSIF